MMHISIWSWRPTGGLDGHSEIGMGTSWAHPRALSIYHTGGCKVRTLPRRAWGGGADTSGRQNTCAQQHDARCRTGEMVANHSRTVQKNVRMVVREWFGMVPGVCAHLVVDRFSFGGVRRLWQVVHVPGERGRMSSQHPRNGLRGHIFLKSGRFTAPTRLEGGREKHISSQQPGDGLLRRQV